MNSMDCEQNCGTCSSCDTSGSCGGLIPGDGEILTQIAAFGREFSRKLLGPNSHSGHAGDSLRSVLFGKFLRITPDIPRWIDRDRFIVADNNILPWLYLAGFPIQLDEIISFGKVGNTSKNFPSLGIERETKSPIAKAVDVAISHKKMIASLRQRGVPCLSKVLGLVGNISSHDPAVAESLQLAADAKLDNLILISEVNTTNDSARIPSAELCAMGFSIDEIGEGDVRTIYGKLIRARINNQRQPQIIILHNHSDGNAETSPGTIHTGTIAPEDFFIPDHIHNHFAISNMRRNSDSENWQYRFECAVDFHPEILQFVEAPHAH
jgi:transketolase